MVFIAKYLIPTRPTFAPYYRTIAADSLQEADKIARQYCRKQYIVATLTQKEE